MLPASSPPFRWLYVSISCTLSCIFNSEDLFLVPYARVLYGHDKNHTCETYPGRLMPLFCRASTSSSVAEIVSPCPCVSFCSSRVTPSSALFVDDFAPADRVYAISISTRGQYIDQSYFSASCKFRNCSYSSCIEILIGSKNITFVPADIANH